jgi:hypothetical protein
MSWLGRTRLSVEVVGVDSGKGGRALERKDGEVERSRV